MFEKYVQETNIATLFQKKNAQIFTSTSSIFALLYLHPRIPRGRKRGGNNSKSS